MNISKGRNFDNIPIEVCAAQEKPKEIKRKAAAFRDFNCKKIFQIAAKKIKNDNDVNEK